MAPKAPLAPLHVSTYPSLDEVDRASRTRIAYWMRYLASPGLDAAGKPNFADVTAMESATMDLISERHTHLGGWQPRLSKDVDRLHEKERT